MKSKFAFTILLMIALSLISCDKETIRASGAISTVAYSFEDYSRLEISGDFNAFVTFSDTEERIEIRANENLQDKIVVSKQGNTLRIRLENNVSIRGNATLDAYISTGEISGYRVLGDSSVELENLLVANNVFVEVLGDSRFFGEVAADELLVDAKGDSFVDVLGTANSVDAYLSGDSLLKDYGLATEDLVIRLSGDSEAHLTVSNTIEVDASGDSELNYKGDALITHQRLTGDSKIRKRD